MGSILLVRHGQASFGAADYDCLSLLGERQARLLGEWLAHTGQPVDRIALGGLRRHRQSAERFCDGLGSGGIVTGDWLFDSAFDEFDHAEVLRRCHPEFADHEALEAFLAGKASPQRAFQQLFSQAVERWRSGRHDADYRETWEAFQHRCVAALRRLAERVGAMQRVVVFTSGGPIGAICQSLLGIPGARILDLHWGLLNTGVTTLYQHSGRLRLGTLNSVAHLDRARDPNLLTYR